MEDNDGLRNQLRWALADTFSVHVARNRKEALAVMADRRPALVILDLGLPPDSSGTTEGHLLLESLIGNFPGTKVIVASGIADRHNALKAIADGAYDFFSKPLDIEKLQLILDRAWRVAELEAENRRLSQAAQPSLGGIIAASPNMVKVCEIVERVAPTDLSVMILGETGTGKEMLARALHSSSERANGPFVAVNCAAIPENLLESELFGYERGAFTGAFKQNLGKIEQARGGTLFLDEICDMPVALQPKLLRFLQDHKIQRIGGALDIAVDLRIVSASNRDPDAMARDGKFRADLLFRLNEVTVTAPTLRSRNDDAWLIAHALLRRFSLLYRRPNLEFSPGALAAIGEYKWPGNVRELEGRVKSAVVLARGNRVTPADLGLPKKPDCEEFVTLKEVRQNAEVSAIERALAWTNNNRTRAAKLLGVTRPTLYNLLADYDINTNPQ